MIKAPAAGTKGFIVELNGDWGLLPGNPHEGDGDDNGDELEKEDNPILCWQMIMIGEFTIIDMPGEQGEPSRHGDADKGKYQKTQHPAFVGSVNN